MVEEVDGPIRSEETIYLRIAKTKPPANKDYQTFGTKAKVRFNNIHIPRIVY